MLRARALDTRGVRGAPREPGPLRRRRRHEKLEAERVAEQHARYMVVEKDEGVRDIAERTDPHRGRALHRRRVRRRATAGERPPPSHTRRDAPDTQSGPWWR